MLPGHISTDLREAKTGILGKTSKFEYKGAWGKSSVRTELVEVYPAVRTELVEVYPAVRTEPVEVFFANSSCGFETSSSTLLRPWQRHPSP